MNIVEVDKGRYVNLDQVFRIDIVKMDKSESYYLKFYSSNDQHTISKSFPNKLDARDWLNLCVIRSAGANEILEL